jgi:hypothetical protein
MQRRLSYVFSSQLLRFLFLLLTVVHAAWSWQNHHYHACRPLTVSSAVPIHQYQFTMLPVSLPSSSSPVLSRTTRPRLSSLSLEARRNRDDDDVFEALVPETSFGAETVPEEQRPVNEYLNVLRQPLYDWPALASGSGGLLTRLLVLYAVVFAVICYPISSASKYYKQSVSFRSC